ncbi:MAG: DUF5011 domain-containing protein [Bacillus subtilis]|nr:DUF5011 domain-containing protein [Bacillus subtilis]
MIIGANDQVIFVGDAWDPLTDVTAIDNRDGSLTAQIVVSGTYDVNVAGYYQITYSVGDQAGKYRVETITLRVKAPELAGFNIPNGDFCEIRSKSRGAIGPSEGGASTVTIVDGVLVYNVTAIGNQTYSNQFSQLGSNH